MGWRDRFNGLRSGPRWRAVSLWVLAALLLYYGIGGWLAAGIDTDLTLRPSPASLPPGGSVTAAMASRLIGREVDERSWTPNDSFLSRTAFLDNKPAYQDGLRATVQAAVGAMGDDPDVAAANLALQTPSDRWWLHSGWPFLGGAAEGEYRDAVAALDRYDQRLGAKQAVFERGPERLAAVLDALAARLDAVSGGIERAISGRRAAADRAADEEFYRVRGSAYAATMLLRGLREDEAGEVRARQLGLPWNEAADALDRAVQVHPMFVGRADLTEQGYYLLLARGKLKALANAARGAR